MKTKNPKTPNKHLRVSAGRAEAMAQALALVAKDYPSIQPDADKLLALASAVRIQVENLT